MYYVFMCFSSSKRGPYSPIIVYLSSFCLVIFSYFQYFTPLKTVMICHILAKGPLPSRCDDVIYVQPVIQKTLITMVFSKIDLPGVVSLFLLPNILKKPNNLNYDQMLVVTCHNLKSEKCFPLIFVYKLRVILKAYIRWLPT